MLTLENIDARLTILEDFIGDISKISVYATSLQKVIDKYLSPLYIESGEGHTMLVDGYLGDLSDIPHNVVFKIRASHTLDMTGQTRAQIIFKKSTGQQAFSLRKYRNGLLQDLNTGDYLEGIIYDVYINSQDVAIITSNDSGNTALAEITVLQNALEDVQELLTGFEKQYAPIDAETGEPEGKDTIIITDNLTVSNGELTTKDLTVTGDIDMSSASGFQLPANTTVQAPSTALGIANRAYVLEAIDTAISNYHSQYHFVGTTEAATAMQDKPNGSFYYKLSN